MSADSIESFFRAWLALARKQVRLFNLEAKLAKQSIVPFIIFSLLLFIAGITLCTFSLFTLAYCLYYFTANLLISILITQLVCVLGFIAIFKFCSSYFKQLLFIRTRQHFKHSLTKKIELQQEDV